MDYITRKTNNPEISGFADSGFRTDMTAGKSQTGYIFMKCGAPISWKSTKQTITATSTNHAELLAFHEAARECCVAEDDGGDYNGNNAKSRPRTSQQSSSKTIPLVLDKCLQDSLKLIELNILVHIYLDLLKT